MKTIHFETDMGSGYIEYTHRDDTFKNDTFDIIVEEVYSFYTEDDVINDIEKNIYKYIWVMKAKIILATAKSLEVAVMSIAFVGLAVAIINLCTGNFGSTATFEP